MKATARYFITISVMMIIIMLIPCISLAEERTVLLGDADGDGAIMIVDCTLIQRDIVGLAEIKADNRIAADVDSDGEICILDATAIQRYLAEMNDNYPIGEYISESSSAPSHLPTVSVSGKTITVDDVAFDIALLPDRTTISDSKTNSKTLMLCTKANLALEDITIQVNNGEYDHKTDYSDERFKESYLMTHNGKVAYGYDCLVRNDRGEAVAWVEAHYCDGWSNPFRVKIYGLKADSFTFPVEFFYKGVSLSKSEVTVALS